MGELLNWQPSKDKRRSPWDGRASAPWRVLAVVTELEEVEDIQLALRLTRYDLWIAERLEKAMEVAHRYVFDVVLLDLELLDSHPQQTFARFHAAAPELPVVVIARPEVQELGSLAILQGARARVLRPELRRPELVSTIAEALPRRKRRKSHHHRGA